jgi:hypothetical protein
MSRSKWRGWCESEIDRLKANNQMEPMPASSVFIVEMNAFRTALP